MQIRFILVIRKMGIIPGFGSTEKEQEETVRGWVFDCLGKHYQDKKDPNIEFFNDGIVKGFSAELEDYKKKIKKTYDKADNAEKRPERYFHIDYGTRVAYDMDTIFVRIEFWHINSQHALSPDGMALMQSTSDFVFTTENLTNPNR